MKDIKTQIFMKYKSFMYQKIDTVFKRTLKKSQFVSAMSIKKNDILEHCVVNLKGVLQCTET